MKFRFISDPGHGWCEVEMALVNKLGIADKISGYSYVKGDFAYLEEDCDYAVFVHAMKAGGDTVELVEVFQENTPIRNYRRYPTQVKY
jgi:hypothetical protein